MPGPLPRFGVRSGVFVLPLLIFATRRGGGGKADNKKPRGAPDPRLRPVGRDDSPFIAADWATRLTKGDSMTKRKKGAAAPPEAKQPAKRVSACDAVVVKLPQDSGMFKRYYYLTDTPERKAAAEAREQVEYDAREKVLYHAESVKRVYDAERVKGKGWSQQPKGVQNAFSANIKLRAVLTEMEAGRYDLAILAALTAGSLVERVELREFDEQITQQEKAFEATNHARNAKTAAQLAEFKEIYSRLAPLHASAPRKQLYSLIAKEMTTLPEGSDGKPKKIPTSTLYKWLDALGIPRRSTGKE